MFGIACFSSEFTLTKTIYRRTYSSKSILLLLLFSKLYGYFQFIDNTFFTHLFNHDAFFYFTTLCVYLQTTSGDINQNVDPSFFFRFFFLFLIFFISLLFLNFVTKIRWFCRRNWGMAAVSLVAKCNVFKIKWTLNI